MKDVGFSINDTLYDAYKNSSTSRVASNNLTISGGPNSTGDFNAAPVLGEEPKSFYTAQLQQSWENDYNDVAIVMLAREGGEDCEMMMEDPDGISALALHQDEKRYAGNDPRFRKIQQDRCAAEQRLPHGIRLDGRVQRGRLSVDRRPRPARL